MTRDKKIESLTNFLNMVTKNENLFVKTDEIKGKTFAIAEKKENGTLSVKTNFMTYEEMNCYFFGVLAVQEKRVNF